MSGMGHLVMGAILLIVGASGAAIAFLGKADTLTTIFLVSLLLGFIQTSWGLLVLCLELFRKPIRRARFQPMGDFYGVTLAMIATATADGAMSDGKIDLMRHCLQMLFGSELSSDDMRHIVEERQSSESDVIDLLASISDTIEEDMKPMIVRACYMVALADGGISDKQAETLDKIATIIGLSINEYRQTIEELQQAIDEEFDRDLPAAGD